MEAWIKKRVEQELFNRRIPSLYRGMCDRAKKLNRRQEIDFDVAWLSNFARVTLGTECPWCSKIITAKNMTPDHVIPVSRQGSFGKDNLEIVCHACNSKKGALTSEEFDDLMDFINKTMCAEAKKDILKRLGSARQR